MVLTRVYRPNQYGKRGFLAFTSATGAVRGKENCAISSSGKFALRGLSQTLAKEFKMNDIHVSRHHGSSAKQSLKGSGRSLTALSTL